MPGRDEGAGGGRWGWARPAIGLIALALSLGGAEIALRGAGFGDVAPDEMGVGDDLLPAPRPRGGPVWDARLGVEYTVDEDGYRTVAGAAPSGAEPTAASRPQVAFLGDSFVFGICVEDDDTLPEAVRRAMMARGAPIEVLNWGVGGANTHQQAIVAADQLAGARPDVLVLVVIENDAEVMPWNPDPLASCGLEVTGLDRAGRALLERVYLYRLATSAVFPCRGPRRCARHRFDNDWPTGRCFARSFDAILGGAADASVEPLVVYFPQVTRAPWRGAHPEAARAEIIGERAAEHGASYLSMIELFTPLDPVDISCERPDGTRERHPSPRGHRIAAEAIAAALEELLAPAPGAPRTVLD